jgi:hypothetical protein
VLYAVAGEKDLAKYPHLTVVEMINSGDKWNDKDVVVEGCYSAMFETSDLFPCDQLHERYLRAWVDEPPHSNGHAQLKETGFRYRRVVLLGRYATGRNYGHMSGYRHKFTVLRVISQSRIKRFPKQR